MVNRLASNLYFLHLRKSPIVVGVAQINVQTLKNECQTHVVHFYNLEMSLMGIRVREILFFFFVTCGE